MKKLLIFMLTGLVLSSIFFYACNKSDQISDNDTKLEKMSTTSNPPVLIATISNGNAQPVFNINTLKNSLISAGLFNNIDELSLDYGSVNNQQEAYLTIIGNQNGDAVSFQATLLIQGQNIYIEDPGSNPPQTMAKHSCAGSPCSSCQFVRGGGLFGWGVTGCDCPSGGTCNHTVSSDNSWLLSVAIAILGML